MIMIAERSLERGVKPLNPEVSKDEIALVKAYSSLLKFTLTDLRLKSIKVSEKVEVRDASLYDNRRTLGLSGFGADSLAIVASSETPEGLSETGLPVATLLIVPKEDGLPLYIDRDNRTMWSDFFYVCEGGILKPIKTSQPIPIDGLYPMYDSKRDFDGLEEYLPMNARLFNTTNDKWRTREIFAEAGIRIPRGELITQGELSSAKERIEAIIQNNPNLKGLVIKGNGGSGGTLVKMFSIESPGEAEAYVRHLIDKGYDVIVEERILPLQAPIDQGYGVRLDGDRVDYNLRVLVTLGEEPQVIDSEIRYDLKGDSPINIHQGAHAVRSGEVLDPITMRDVNRIAKRATYSLWNATSDRRSNETGFVGIDIIVDDSGRPYVIEANSGAVGGFGTLCRLDRKPLTSIAEILIPSAEPFLFDNFQRRKNPGVLDKMPLHASDYTTLGFAFLSTKNFPKAEQYLTKALEINPVSTQLLINMATLNLFTKNYERALEYAQRAWETDPTDLYNTAVIADCFRRLGRYQEGIDFIDARIEEGKISDLIVCQRAALEIVMNSNEDEARKIIRKYRDIDHNEQFHRTAEFFVLANAYLALGRKLKAIPLIAKGYGSHGIWLSSGIIAILKEGLHQRRNRRK